MSKIKVGMFGLGVVGCGVYNTIQSYNNIELVKICVKNKDKPRDPSIDKSLITTDPDEIIKNKEIQLVIEVVGGTDPALSYVLNSLKNNKHVVTANKELLAKNWKIIHETAKENNKVILFEASVGGALPLLMPIKTVLCANKINKIKAIINGTTNFILTKILYEKMDYSDALKLAQQLGFAETDPTNDVEGFDAVFKLTVLSNLCFKKSVDYQKIYREGITKVSLKSMIKANEFGYNIKLIAFGEFLEKENKYDLRVHPTLVCKEGCLANVNEAINCVQLNGFPMKEVFIGGCGAGSFPTASSVVGDVLNIINNLNQQKEEKNLLPMMKINEFDSVDILDIKETINKYFICIQDIESEELLKVLGEFNIGLNKLTKGNKEYVFITEEVKEDKILQALANIKKKGKVEWFIRVEK